MVPYPLLPALIRFRVGAMSKFDCHLIGEGFAGCALLGPQFDEPLPRARLTGLPKVFALSSNWIRLAVNHL